MQHSRLYTNLIWFIFALFLFLAVCVTASPPRKYKQDCVRVYPGHSIQYALDNAHPGSRIEVIGGTYQEQLTITTDDIHLIGKQGAILFPPTSFAPNPCTGLSRTFDNKSTEAGICVHSKDFELEPYIFEHRRIKSVGSPIKNVRISGFTIRDFDGENIAALGASNLHVHNNQLINGGQYGLLTVGCKSTRATHNTISTSAISFIGMNHDDFAASPPSSFSDNFITGYFTALVSQSPGGVLKDNKVENVCVGAAADPGTAGSQIVGNNISTRRPDCSPLFAAYGAGIVVYGATKTVVEKNYIEKFRNNGTGVGVFLLDGPGREVARDNLVERNVLRENEVDIYDNSTVARTGGNVLRGNDCSIEGVVFSFPVGACA